MPPSLGRVMKLLGNEVRAARRQERWKRRAAFVPMSTCSRLVLPSAGGYEVARRLRQIEGTGTNRLARPAGWDEDEDRKRSHENGTITW